MSDGADRPRRRAVDALLGAAVGATAWITAGVVAAIDPDRGTRLVAMPPWPWLIGLVALGAGGGAIARLPGSARTPLVLLALPWLPLLPWRVPPAFLVWDGPLEGAVWTTAVAGTVVAWWRARGRVAPLAGTFSIGRQAWLAGLLALVVALAAWATVRPRVPSGDEPHYLVITQSLLRDGDLRIEDNHRDEQYLAYFDGALKPDFMRRGVDRQIYSIHAPGTAVAVLPAFAVAGYAGAVVMVAALVGLGVTALWRAARQLSGSAGGAWAATLALVTASPCVLLAFTIYPDPIGSAIVAAALWTLVRLDAGVALPARAWVATGAALAFLPWLHTRFAVLAAAFGAVLALRAHQGAGGWRDGVRLLAVPVVSAAAWFGYFQVIYGTPDPGAPYGAGTGSGLSFVPTGLAGLLVDQQFGLLANAPALAAGVAGAAWLARERPRLAVELAIGVVPYLVTAASFPMWWGGYSSPARFAVVIAPAVALPVALLWARTARAGRTAVTCALVVSAAITVAVVGVDRGAFVYNGRDGHALLLDWLSATADLTLAAPSVHRDGPFGATADTLVWVVAAAGTLALAARVARLSAVLTWLGVPLVMMLAASVVWAGWDRPIVTVPTSSLRYLAAWRDGALPVTAQLSPARRLDGAAGIGRLLLASSTRGAPEASAPWLLRVPDVPAGDYDVFVDATGEPEGMATVHIGRQARQGLTVEQWPFAGRRAGFAGLTLRLPVDVHSVTVVGDDPARRSIRGLALRPRALAPAGAPAARGAARYGRVVVYTLDDAAYLEAGAFWTRGERAAALAVQADRDVAPVLRVKSGPVATRVRLAADAWQQELDLAADASADVALPAEALAPAVLTIATDRGFRPSAFDGASGDVRWLGVYVTWPDGPAAPVR
jgi:hypothetical protein